MEIDTNWAEDKTRMESLESIATTSHKHAINAKSSTHALLWLAAYARVVLT